MTTVSQDELLRLVGQVDNEHRRLALDKLLEAYVPSSEVAREIGTTQSYIRKLVTTGRLRAYKIGGSLLIEKASWAEFLATRRTTAGRPKKDRFVESLA